LTWIGVGLAAGGCGADGDTGTAGRGTRSTAAGGGGETRDETPTPDAPGDPSTSPPVIANDGGVRMMREVDAACESVAEEAEAEVLAADIVVIIDNSGSMSDEAAAVQAQMNGFSSQIVAAGIDVQVALVSSYPGDGNGMCIPPPLGAVAPGCPGVGGDNNPPAFLHVNQRVSSNNSLELLLSTYPQYQSIFRPDSTKHFIVITDDDSDMAADAFNTQLQMLQPGARVHGVYCFTDCDGIAAAVGTVYQTLVPMTGGISVDFCLQDFKLVFDEVSKEVIGGATLSCEYDIPPPPGDEAFDPLKTNVSYTPGGGMQETLGHVQGLPECAGVTSGWYFSPDETAPTKIIACPDTCARFQDDLMGKVEIVFGCERKEQVPL
jgi:hypothetical protein